ncbi:uncharacterized protein LOC127182720 isoform X3 [Labeo rohita]|uniref:uncharacterized protein LOC127182720 isoform X3 n=1 Tax=Labeo rohita TaxID=84645 RepID=UPI0021E2D0B4|nr:uncharacterized protein LOC127182720 isoform X3 [Labeo rohita]
MSAYSSVLGVAVLFLHLWGTHSFPTSTCPVPCLCQRGPLLNCSSLGLTEIPTRIPGTAVSLNISNNALRSLAPLSFGHVKLKRLLHLWVGSNALESLSLILKKDRSGTRTLTSGQQECTSWAPDLQLLSAERNHLKHLPKGLGCIKSLQILQLSYNQISEIGLTDLDNCIHLKELHLQHNNITSIHQHAFVNLKHLQVLDLSYNMLVTIPVPAYQSLRNLNALVDVSFNRWKCDCNLQTLRRWISFDTEIGDASWQVVCASPPHHAGKDLLHLKDSELTCPTHEYSTSGRYHNMIVDEGMQISIPCSNDSQDIMQVHWWTPQGQVRDNQPKLIIKDITEQQAGLYVCVSGLQGEHISVFDLHVYKKGSGSRSRREAATILNEQENTNAPRNVLRQRTESNFVLAVCLSVIITFIVAFILGVLLRPLLDKLWMRIRSKRRSTTPTTTTTSSAGPQPYVNEGYSDVEDQEVRSGSRVTFGGITEVEVPYYVTVENNQADGSSESNTEVEPQYETVKKNESSITGGKRQALERETHRGRADSSSSSSLQEGEVNALVINGKKLPTYSTKNMAKSMEFEPIPDANDITELKRRGSSSSSSSQSSQEGNFSRESEQSVDPPAVTIPGNKNTMGRIPGFSTDPFPERPNRLTELNVDELDPELWNDSGESFSFNESSERSSIRDLSNSALGHPLKDDFDKPFGKELNVDDNKQLNRSNRVSSSSSSESVESIDGPNKYVVNPEEMDKSDIENYANSATLNRFGSLKDVTLNERMPSAGILIRQEAVTHDSVDDNMHIYDISDKPGVCVDVGLDTVPKVKRYIEFKQFKPHSGPPTLPSFSSSSTKNTLPDKITLPSLTTKDAIQETRRYSSSSSSSSEDGELTTEEDNFFRKIGVSSDGVAKVKRFITFKQFEPSSPLIPSFTKKDEMLEAKSYSSSSDDDDDHHLTTKSHNVDVSSVGVSNVKRYSSSSDDDDDPLTTKGDNEDVSSVRVSKVKRYITFKQFESPSPSPPSFTKKDEMLVAKSYSSSSDDDDDHHLTTKSHKVDVSSVGVSNVKRYSSSSDDDDPLTTKGDNVDVSSVRVSKVKRYITFKQFESRSPSPPSFTKKDEMLVAKSYSSSSDDDDDHHLTTKSHNVDVSSVGVSNVKRYSSSSDDDDDDDPLTTKGDNVDVSSVRVSKVKRYITFKQFESPSPSPPSFTKKDEMLVAKSYSSSSDDDDDHHLTTKSHKVDVSSVGVSNVKRYSSSSDDDDPLTTKGDSVDVSSVRVSKVKRYITFKQFETPSPSPPSFTKKDEMVEAKSYSSSSDDDDDHHLTTKSHNGDVSSVGVSNVKRYSSSSDDDDPLTTKGDSVDVSSVRVSKVKRYITFKQFEPPSPSPPSFTKKDEMLEAKSYSSSSDDDDDHHLTTKSHNVDVSSVGVSNVKRYSSSSDDDDPLTTKGDNVDVSSVGVSKVKRYISFTQLESSSPTLSVSRPSTRIETTTEETIQSVQPSTTPKDTSPNAKKYMYLKHQHQSSSLPSSPTSTRKGLSGKIKRKKQNDQSYSGSQDSLPLYHVHPVYRSSINRLNRGYDTDRSYSSEEEDQFSEYPIEFTMASGINSGSITPDKKADKVLNIDFDNSSSSTDVFDKKHSKGLLKLRALNARLFNRHENETDEGNLQSQVETKSSTVSRNRKPKVTTNENENGLSLDHLPNVKRYLQFSHSDSYQVQLPSPPPTTGVVTPEFIVTTESRRSSSSSEDDVQLRSTPTIGVVTPGFIGTTESRRSSSSSEDDVKLPSLPPSTEVVTPRFIETTESRRSSSSSEDDVKETTEDINFVGQVGASYDRIPKVKRYIKFSSTEPSLTTLPLNKELGAKPESWRSSTSSEDDIKLSTNEDNFFGKIGVSHDTVPNVKRYIQFSQPKPYSPTLTSSSISTKRPAVVVETSSKTSVKLDDKPDATEKNLGGQIDLDAVSKVKRYVQFTQYKHHSPTLPSPPSLTMKDAIQETRRYSSSSSSSSSDELTTEKDNFFRKIGVASDGVSKVKRFITFKQFEPSSPTLPVSKIEATTETVTSTLTSTSKDDVRSQNENEEIGISLERVPRVKRYIQFKQPVSHLPVVSPTTSDKLQVTPRVETKSEARRSSSSSEDDVKPTAKVDNVFGQTGTSLDRVPRVRRYIQFTRPEIQSPVQTTTSLSSERVIVTTVAKETRRWSTSSSEEDVKLTTKKENIREETGEYLPKIPKVKRYIKFTQPEPYTSNLSPFRPLSTEKYTKVTETKLKPPATRDSTSSEDDVQEDNGSGQTGVSLNRVSRVKRYIQFTHTESQPPTQSASSVSAQRLGVLGAVQDTRRSSSSSEDDDDKPSIRETGESLDKIPKVKSYIQFTQYEPSAQSKLPSSSVAKSIKVTAIPTTNENKTESMTQITSSGSVDRVTRVKRYIQFTPTESQYPSWASTAVWAERVEISGVAQETKIPSTSAEYVKPNYSITGKTDTSFFQETGVSLDKIPKVNRYIAFTKNEPSSTKLMKRDLTPATQWSSLSSEMSPPASLKKGSALIIKTQSQSWKSESNSAEQTGLKSKLRKSSSSSSDESIGHNVVDVQALQDEPPAVPLTSPPPLEQENAREYLRENSEVRQRQERRRLQQQRRREMDEFDIASLSSMQQEGDKQNRSPADYGVTPFQTEHAYSNVFTSSTLSSRSTEGAEAPVLRGLKTKSTSTPSSKTPTSKYREYLI